MPLKIKIPKHSTQPSGSSQSTKLGKRRVDSDVEEDYSREITEEPVPRPRSKRARTYGSSGADEGENDVDVDVDVDGVDDEVSGGSRAAATRDPSSSTSPPPVKASKRSSKPTASDRRGSTVSTSKQKRKTRQVVWTDDEDDDVDPLGLTAMDPDDEEFEPGPSSSKRSNAMSKTSTKPVRTKAKVEAKEKEIVIRDERKLPPSPPPKEKPPAPRIPLKRAPSSDERVEAPAETSAAASADLPESTPLKVEEAEPPPQKRKLPPIKKNKMSTSMGPSTPTPAKPPAAVPIPESSTPSKESNGPVGVAARKPAATLGASDFDLRDKSVYDQLFNRSKQTPDSGLNRKQREEERRKCLYKLRDEARAKRAEEAKHTFDLQAAHDKIVRFEEKLRAHNSIALFPNVLGAYWKDPKR